MSLMSRTHRRLALPTAAALVLVAASCSSSDEADPGGEATTSDDAALSVLASFYPLQFLAEQVGGDLVEVTSLTPPGAEPHDLELSPAQVRTVADAGLVLYLSGFQPAVDEAIEARRPQHVVDAADFTTLVPAEEHNLEEDEHAKEEGEEEDDHGGLDPHFWLDPTQLPAVADGVAEQLAQIDPDNAGTYLANAAAVTSQLQDLDEEYTQGLASCELTTFVTAHSAFGYLADRYGLDQVGISGIDPEAEPSPARLTEVRQVVEERGVDTIFFEELVSPKVAQTLADDLGIDAEVLDPIEGLSDDATDYLGIMRTNLAALQGALHCS